MPSHSNSYARNAPFATKGPWITPLTPEQERMFRAWVKANKVPFDPDEANPDYDMRGFFKALVSGDKRALTAVNSVDKKLHFPDIWKTPEHKSFSRESMYATPNNPYDWKGETLIDQRSGKGIFQTMPRQ